MSLLPELDPDSRGRFTEAGVAHLASRRGCVLVGVEKASAVIRKAEDLDAEVEFAMWGEEGRWYPADVYAACTRARGETVHPWEKPAGVKLPESAFDQELVARLVACDGVRVWYGREWTIAYEAVLRTTVDGLVLFGDRKAVKRAVLAVADADLATLTLGPRNGWVAARLAWHDRAKRPPPTTPEQRAAATAEDNAIAEISGRDER